MNKQTNIDQIIDEASKESFPASDPPAWICGKDKVVYTDKKLNNDKEKEEDQLTAQTIKELEFDGINQNPEASRNTLKRDVHEKNSTLDIAHESVLTQASNTAKK